MVVPVRGEPTLDRHFLHVVVLLRSRHRRQRRRGRRLLRPVVPAERRGHRFRSVVTAAVRQHGRVADEVVRRYTHTQAKHD